jgi:hypothetical protein
MNGLLVSSLFLYTGLLCLHQCLPARIFLLLSSHIVFCFHHFCSVQLMFFISTFSPSVHAVIFIDYSSTTFYRETTTSLCHNIFILFLPSSFITLCISNAQVRNITKRSGIMIPMLRNNDSITQKQ